MTHEKRNRPDDPRLTAFALDELEGEERAEIERLVASDADAAREVAAIRAFAREIEGELALEEGETLGAARRDALLPAAARRAREIERARLPRASRFSVAGLVALGSVAAACLGVFVYWTAQLVEQGQEASGGEPYTYSLWGDPPAGGAPATGGSPRLSREDLEALASLGYTGGGGSESFEGLQAAGYVGDDDQGIGHGGGEVDRRASREGYAPIVENPFEVTARDPLSTFSIDVDTASYANVRRFLRARQLPPRDAVRIEELVNYFAYDDPPPAGALPFSARVEVAECPWAPPHRLVRIGLRARDLVGFPGPPKNLVFLVDVSGSMDSPSKLPLLVRSMRLLVEQLTPQDKVAIVVYAGAAGLVLPATGGFERERIDAALASLSAGGSTNGGAGIQLAYRVARENFVQGGINRVILATDGDFNVGVDSTAGLERLIEEERRSGVFLSVLGFGTGNLQDQKMERLADVGNGNYAYVDSLEEARKVLVHELGATLETVAKDVKLQVEFDPARVRSFRLIGYENRLLAHEDFDDDAKDAGEIGAGHSVTALYELELVDPALAAGELFTLRLRYKEPDGETSRLVEIPGVDRGLRFSQASNDLRFAAAVAAFGMLLCDSEHAGDATFEDVARWARGARGADAYGYRSEFLELVELARGL